ncbi:MAG: hypothetical protein M0030_14565 [Actinomycetota bacterium]|nr:hypothetical protein [Actinomycetota bacterium]
MPYSPRSAARSPAGHRRRYRHAAAAHLRTQWWDNAGSRAHATVVTVAADRATTGVDAAMRH